MVTTSTAEWHRSNFILNLSKKFFVRNSEMQTLKSDKAEFSSNLWLKIYVILSKFLYLSASFTCEAKNIKQCCYDYTDK